MNIDMMLTNRASAHLSSIKVIISTETLPLSLHRELISTDPLPTQEHVTHASFLGFC